MFLLESTSFYSLREASEERCYYLDFETKRIKFSFCQLLALRQKLNEVDIDSLFSDETNSHDFKILTLCNHEHLFLLSTLEMIDLKRLLHNAFVSMGISRSPVAVTF